MTKTAWLTYAVTASMVLGLGMTARGQEADPSTPEPPTLVAGREGFAVRSADGAFQLRLRGYFQTDGRFFIRDEEETGPHGTLLLRRLRPSLEVTMYRFMDFRLVSDFGEGRVALVDAQFDFRFHPAVNLRAGKFKPPLGLERLQSSQDLLFVERGLPTNLAPSRDIGIQVCGDLAGGAVSYAAGVFNGVPDLGVGDADLDRGKDVAARVFTHPLRERGPALLNGLGVGIGVTRGDRQGTIAAPLLPGYRSPSQQVVFGYRADGSASGTVVADGPHLRMAPQGYLYAGPVGVLAEYTRSSQHVRRAPIGRHLHHSAWQVAGGIVLTGEPNSYRGVVPRRPFDPDDGGWGAFEVGVRMGALRPDAGAFPTFSDPASHVRRAGSWGTTFNWYLARGIRLMVDYEQTRFDGGGAAGGDRPTERVVLTRLQHAF